MLNKIHNKLFSNLIFSFDVGSNSIGWSVLQLGKEEPIAIINTGARIFSDGREVNGTPLAVNRREKRSARKMRDRHVKRQKKTLEALIAYGLLPDDKSAREEILKQTGDRPEGDTAPKTNVYSLRKRALSEKLPLPYIARALFHLGQRRGFKSNRKADRKSNEKGKIAVGVEQLQGLMRDAKAPTLGAYLAQQHEAGKVVRIRANSEAINGKDYAFYPERAMLEDEFYQIWAAQAYYYPEILTEQRRDTLFNIMFYQRPLKAQEVGLCSYNLDEKRIEKAHPLFQLFRLYKEINELAIVLPNFSTRKLTIEERDLLITLLRPQKSKTFAQMRKALKLPQGQKFNKETKERDRLIGDQVYASFIHKEKFGAEWAEFSLAQQWEIVEKLRHEDDDDKLEQWLQEKFPHLSNEQIIAIANVHLPEGHGRLGITALQQMLGALQKAVIPESEAAKLCGYDHALQNRGQSGADFLPKYQEVLERHIVPGTGDSKDPYDINKGRITNPTVHIGLNQLRRIVNRLLKRYGKPEKMVVELARDLPLSAEQRDKVKKSIATNTKAATERSKKLVEHNHKDNGYNRLIIKLWEELAEKPEDRVCVYSGEVICPRMLFSGEVEIDHILPWSKTLDDSQANKILCLRAKNREKGNRAPADVTEWEDRYDAIVARAANLPDNKKWRFAKNAIDRFKKDEGFLSRQLTDTQYLAKMTREYLNCLYPSEEADEYGELKKVQHVYVVPGRLTELLRRNWGLNSILSDDENKPKNRQDHRHHAIDAIVVGVTTRSLLQRIATAAGRLHEQDFEDFVKKAVSEAPPWHGFREDVKQAIEKIIVSHKQDHGTINRALYANGKGKTAGQLHNDTAYGITGEKDEKGNTIVVSRKSFLDLEYKDIAKIRDAHLRSELEIALSYIIIENSKGNTEDNSKQNIFAKKIKQEILNFSKTHKQFKGIRHVRIVETLNVIPIKDKNGKIYKSYKGDSNYRYDVWETLDGKWHSEVVSTFDVHQPNWHSQFHAKNPTARKVLSLQQNDMVAFEDEKKGYMVGRVVKFVQDGRIYLAPHNEANVDSRDRNKNDSFKFTCKSAQSLKKIQCRQIHVDEIGIVLDPGPQDRQSKTG